jgi:ribosomal protein L37AE/L43A
MSEELFFNAYTCEKCGTHYSRETNISWEVWWCPYCNKLNDPYSSEPTKSDKYWDEKENTYWAM